MKHLDYQESDIKHKELEEALKLEKLECLIEDYKNCDDFEEFILEPEDIEKILSEECFSEEDIEFLEEDVDDIVIIPDIPYLDCEVDEDEKSE